MHNTLLTVTLEIVLPCASTGESYKPVFSSVQLNVNHVAESCTVEPLYYEHLGTIHKCPDYQGANHH